MTPDYQATRLAPPPRHLPTMTRLVILFGGAINQMGWFFMMVGLPMVLIFGFMGGAMIPGALLAGIFPIIGGLFAFFSMRRNWKAILLLHQGQTARGKLVDKQATNTKINDQTVYEYSFAFKTPDGQKHIAKGKTHHTHLLEDEETEFLLYMADDPDNAMMYDAIPHAPRILPSGEFEALSIFRYWTLIVPGIVMLVLAFTLFSLLN
ncbi:MAG: hypothetical protein AAF206_32210 [Bacteroidota bacterium]